MRTTVDIDDHRLGSVRELAARTHRPLGAVIDDALRILLAESRRAPTRAVGWARAWSAGPQGDDRLYSLALGPPLI